MYICMYMVKGKLCPCCGFSVLTWLKPIQKMGAITSVKYMCVCMYVYMCINVALYLNTHLYLYTYQRLRIYT